MLSSKYQSFLLRLRRRDQAAPSPFLMMAENTKTGECHYFSEMAELVAFLEGLLDSPDQAERGSQQK